MIKTLTFIVITLVLLAPNVSASENTTYKFSLTDLEAVLSEELAEFGAGDNIQLDGIRLSTSGGINMLASDLDEFRNKTGIEQNDKILTIHNLDFDKRIKKFNAVLKTNENPALPDGLITVEGRYDILIEVPSLARRLYRGDMIKNDDLEWIAITERKAKPGTIISKNDLIGRILNRRISAGRPMRDRDISMPHIIDKGNLVQMIYRKDNMELKTNGRALDDGSIGQVIRIKNEKSGSIIQARVEPSGNVLVNYNDVVAPPFMQSQADLNNRNGG